MKKLLTFILFFAAISVHSQVDYNFLTLRGIPQNLSANPAQMPRYKSHVGLPVLSSVHINLYSSSITWGDLVKVQEDGVPLIDMQSAIDELDDKNFLSAQLEIDLLSFSYRIKSSYFSFGIKERMEIRFGYPKSFLELIWEGNGGSLLGEKVYLDGLGIDFNHFREYAFGIAHDFNGKMILGGRIKYLAGLGNFTTKKSELFFITDENSYATFVGGQFSGQTAGFFNDEGESVDYTLLNSKNHGVALDLGMRYQINSKWELAASVIDFGYINWKENAVTRYDDSVFFYYGGLSVENLFKLEESVDSISDGLINQVDTTFTFKNIASDYRTTLSSSISVGGHYHLNRWVELAAYYNHYSYRGEFQPSFIINSKFSLKNWLDLSANYSIQGSSFYNIGAGAVLNFGPFQFYGVTNNLIAHFKPTLARNANFRFGMNLIFGRKKFKR